MIKIGDFSKLSRISVRMLRHYNEIGLLIPNSIDDFTGYRYYSEKQLPLANRISALKEMGFSLVAIVEILKEYDNAKTLKKFLALKYAEVKEQGMQYIFHADGWFLLYTVKELLVSGKLQLPTEEQRRSLSTVIMTGK